MRAAALALPFFGAVAALRMVVTSVHTAAQFNALPYSSVVLFYCATNKRCANALHHFKQLSEEPRAAPCFSVCLGGNDDMLHAARALGIDALPAVVVYLTRDAKTRCSDRDLECAVRGSAL
jgi:hypothetical protein